MHFNRTLHMLSHFTSQCIDQIQTSKSKNIEKKNADQLKQ